MKRIVILFVALLSVASTSYSGGDPKKPATADIYTKQRDDRTAQLTSLDRTIESAINIPPPNTLTKTQLDEWRKQTQWLIKVQKQMSDHKKSLGTLKQGETMESHMAQMNMQFLALQEATQMESRKFQTLSNASKARHDIALNAIRNMK
jgi:hypothetical protein